MARFKKESESMTKEEFMAEEEKLEAKYEEDVDSALSRYVEDKLIKAAPQEELEAEFRERMKEIQLCHRNDINALCDRV